jgi:K+-transporting ATPase ATPase A chain
VVAAGIHSNVGNTEGKEVRFGDTTTALFGVASTSTSTGSANASYDSFTPMGGFFLMTGMMLGEVTPGGAGSGLYTILIYAIIAVFIGGLMIGRTPEYLGKKIQAKRSNSPAWGPGHAAHRAHLHGHRRVHPRRRAGPLNAGPHGFSEILYGLTSQGNNNGSAFGGLTGNTTFYNVIGSIDMLIGRYGIMIPALALGGVLAAKNVVPESLGTFRTDNGMFVGLTIGVIVIIGGLTFFPAISLGPIVEQLSHGSSSDDHDRHPHPAPTRQRPAPTAWPRPAACSTARSSARPWSTRSRS